MDCGVHVKFTMRGHFTCETTLRKVCDRHKETAKMMGVRGNFVIEKEEKGYIRHRMNQAVDTRSSALPHLPHVQINLGATAREALVTILHRSPQTKRGAWLATGGATVQIFRGPPKGITRAPNNTVGLS